MQTDPDIHMEDRLETQQNSWWCTIIGKMLELSMIVFLYDRLDTFTIRLEKSSLPKLIQCNIKASTKHIGDAELISPSAGDLN